MGPGHLNSMGPGYQNSMGPGYLNSMGLGYLNSIGPGYLNSMGPGYQNIWICGKNISIFSIESVSFSFSVQKILFTKYYKIFLIIIIIIRGLDK